MTSSLRSAVPVQGRHIIVLALASLALVFCYYLIVSASVKQTDVFHLHTPIVQGDARFPYRYRILAAWLVEVIKPSATDEGVMIGYAIGHVVALPTMLATMYLWLSEVGTRRAALLGTLLFAALVPLGFRHYALSLYQPIEAILVTLALMLATRRPTLRSGILYAALIIIAMLNRETGIILAPIWALLNWKMDIRGWTLHSAFYAALVLLVFAALHIARGEGEMVMSFETVLSNNITTLPLIFAQNAPMLTVWLIAAFGFGRAPAPLRRLVWVIALYGAGMLVYSLWHEVRLHWSVMPILLAYGVYAIDARSAVRG